MFAPSEAVNALDSDVMDVVATDLEGDGRRDLHQDDRRAVAVLHDFERHARQSVVGAPRANQLDGLVHVAVLAPLGVEHGRLVRDLDVLDQRRDDGLVPGLVHQGLGFGGVDGFDRGHGPESTPGCRPW